MLRLLGGSVVSQVRHGGHSPATEGVTTVERRVGFIGAGQMARVLAAGMLRAGAIRAEQLAAVDPSDDARSINFRRSRRDAGW